MSNKLKIISSKVIGGVSALISVISFIILYISHIVTAYYTIIIFICFITIVLCLLLYKKSMNSILISAVTLLLLSFVSKGQAKVQSSKMEERELISDVTYCLHEEFKINNQDWVVDAIKRGDLYVILIPSSKNVRQFFEEISECLYSMGYSGLHFNAALLLAEMQSRIIYGNYLILMTDLSEIELIDKRHKYWTLLPRSCMEVALGRIDMNEHNYLSAKEHYAMADSLGNATGTYLLAKWYGTGYNMYPDKYKCEELLKKAAENGSRAARMEWGRETLLSVKSSELERGKAEDYLLRSSRIRTVASDCIIEFARESVNILDEYYRVEGRFRDAYHLTKKNYHYFQDDYIKYNKHLDNCLSMCKYSEALDVATEGEKKNIPYCYFSHAVMLMNGMGVSRDYSMAEHILRFAADSLNYSLSYKGLADLYRITNRPGVDFWEGLFEAKFDNRVDE